MPFPLSPTRPREVPSLILRQASCRRLLVPDVDSELELPSPDGAESDVGDIASPRISRRSLAQTLAGHVVARLEPLEQLALER
eukprot:3703248-Rhodomonas_salina.1